MSDTSVTATAYPNLRPWQPGQSGNPKGRTPNGTSVAEYVRQLCGPDAKPIIDQLVAIATGSHRDVRHRIEACKVLLDRGWGKAVETVNLHGSLATLDPARLARLSDAELAAAADLVAKLMSDEP
jgi:hypothetical protein